LRGSASILQIAKEFKIPEVVQQADIKELFIATANEVTG